MTMTSAAPTPPMVLTFSATDPSGGAGMQADLLTLASIGCHPLSVVTGITVQDTVGVEAVMALEADWVNDQARTVLEDVEVAAFKLGMLASIENVAVIAEIVADYPHIPLLIDPVMASGRGDELASEELASAMIELLFPQALLITPNSMEARRLAYVDEIEEDDSATLDDCATRLLETGCRHVLITGTHERSPQVINTLYGRDGVARTWHWDRLPGSYHGSGCTLTAAIAACIAQGLSLEDAVAEAQQYTWQTLKAGFHPGMGQYIPDRMFWAREAEDDDDEPEQD